MAIQLLYLLMEAINASILIVTHLAVKIEAIPHTYSIPTCHIIFAFKIIGTLCLEFLLNFTFLTLFVAIFADGAVCLIWTLPLNTLAHASLAIVAETLIVVDTPITWLFVHDLKMRVWHASVQLVVAILLLISWDWLAPEVCLAHLIVIVTVLQVNL